MAKRGRPKIKIDIQQLEICAAQQWHISEIAAFFRCSRDTLERNYAEIIQESRLRGAAKIRGLQWKRAQEGSDTMIKHMSEHYLNQHARKVELTDEDLDKILEDRIRTKVPGKVD